MDDGTLDITLPPSRIQILQSCLKDCGFYSGPINGIMDDETNSAVDKFRKDRKIDEQVMGSKTWDALLQGTGLVKENYDNRDILMSLFHLEPLSSNRSVGQQGVPNGSVSGTAPSVASTTGTAPSVVSTTPSQGNSPPTQ